MARIERNPDGIMAWLRGLAATGRALRASDLQSERWSTTEVSKALNYLSSQGDLHRAKLAFKQVFYLATEAQAAAYTAQHQPAYTAALLAATQARAEARKIRDAARARAVSNAAAGLRRGKHGTVQIKARPLALQADAPAADRLPPPITYCPSHPVQRCPADRPLVMRPGALDYQRYMAKHQGSAA